MNRKYIDLETVELICNKVMELTILNSGGKCSVPNYADLVKDYVDEEFEEYSENCIPVKYIQERIKIGEEWEEAFEDWQSNSVGH